MDEDDGHNADNLIQQRQRQQQVVQQQLNTEERLKLILILQQKYIECPFRTKKKIDRLVNTFLEDLEDDIHHLLCNIKDEDDIGDGDDGYCGLDSDRDTPAEVETAIRLFPRILSRQGSSGMGLRNGYPIHYLSYIINDSSTHSFLCNLKAHSFIPLVARLAIEFGSFEEHECGGLLIKERSFASSSFASSRDGRTVLNWLMLSDHNSETLNHEDHVELVDNEYLQVLIQLRRMGLLKKKDILNCNLIYSILYNGGPGFSERRFRFVVEWDPTSLLQEQHISNYEIFGKNTCIIPLHHAALNSYIHVFQLVFEYGIRYFPKKKGINLLFKTNENIETPFRLACYKFGCKEVMRVIEESLIRCYSLSLDNNSPSLNVVEALMMAATDESVHLDCVYFILRRQPDVLIKPLSISINNSNNNNGNDNDSDSSVDDGGGGDVSGDDGGGNSRKNEDESVGDSAEYDGNDTSIRDNANQERGNAATEGNHSRNGNGNHVDKEDEESPNSLVDRKRKREIQN